MLISDNRRLRSTAEGLTIALTKAKSRLNSADTVLALLNELYRCAVRSGKLMDMVKRAEKIRKPEGFYRLIDWIQLAQEAERLFLQDVDARLKTAFANRRAR